MYGPVATWFWPYTDGFCLSNFAAYSSGTGAESGSASAPATTPPVPLLRLKTIVWSSGVSMPEIFAPGLAPTFAPTRSPKYAPA
jgi:hypothetical protein